MHSVNEVSAVILYAMTLLNFGFEVLRLGRLSACHVSGSEGGGGTALRALDRLNFPTLKLKLRRWWDSAFHC